MGLLVKTRITTITEATKALTLDQLRGERIEMAADCWPAEWFPQSGVQLTWPHADTDWRRLLDEADRCFVEMAYHISRVERLLVVTPERPRVEALLRCHLPSDQMARVTFVDCETNDTWARDHAFLTTMENGQWTLRDYQFNGWGGKFEAAKDNAINRHLFASGLMAHRYEDCLDFIMEGGAVETDGRGTLLARTSSLLNPNRNPHLTIGDVEARLAHDLHIRHFLWLYHGNLTGDDTDGHIDTLARMCPNDTIAYVKCENPSDDDYAELCAMEEELRQFRTQEGRPYRLVALPMPDPIVEDGERLPATYANFLVINGAVLMPAYNQPENDAKAAKALGEAFPDHDIITVECSVLVRQYGSLHCSTMQYPRGVIQTELKTNQD